MIARIISVSAALIATLSGLAAQTGNAAATKNGAFMWQPGAADAGTSNLFRDDDWYVSDFEIRRGWMATAWRADRAQFAVDRLTLNLLPANGAGTEKPFLGAEVQTPNARGYGNYEVVMQPSDAHGTISSFFTYTGAHFGDPHDEIDIEFLGRDTTRIWLLAFRDGEKLPGAFLDLGFDAAEAPHLYAFDWGPQAIVWSVDGEEIFRIASEAGELPQVPGKVYMNLWAGGPGQREWSGQAAGDTVAEARYFCVSYRPEGASSPQCSDRWPEAE